jgi:hypothetical protein
MHFGNLVPEVGPFKGLATFLGIFNECFGPRKVMVDAFDI